MDSLLISVPRILHIGDVRYRSAALFWQLKRNDRDKQFPYVSLCLAIPRVF